MNVKWIFVSFVFAFLVLSSCNKPKKLPTDEDAINTEQNAKGDSTVYGLACDGTNDSVIVFLPNSGGDPITYDIVGAMQNHRVIGKPQIGDWVGLIINPKDTTEADMVIDLDELKGTWTYPVMPTMKDERMMSQRARKRMKGPMPDSLMQTLMVPREYGFTLKREHQASPVGMIRRATTLEDDSPVKYPSVRMFSEWHIYNGKLVLTEGTGLIAKMRGNNTKIVYDTAEFVMMTPDSLVLVFNGKTLGFHRQASAKAANAAAYKAAAIKENREEQKLK